MTKKILVIGAGAWGSAIANLLAGNNHEVYINSIEDSVLEEIDRYHTNNKYLKDIKLDENLKIIKNYQDNINDFDFVFIVIPSLACEVIFKELAKIDIKTNLNFIICSKGINQNSLEFLGESFFNITKNNNYGILAGPNFAIEVANKIPTISTIASKDNNLAQQIIKLMSNNYFKVESFNDPLNLEICSAIKNIMAIGCGMIEALNLGVNAKSALIMKGIEEIKLLCHALNANIDVSHSAGFGDIFLTCSSTKSRNNSLGHLIINSDNYLDEINNSNVTVEGYYSAKAISKIAKKLEIKLDLCQKIELILNNQLSLEEIEATLTKIILS